MPPPPKSTEEEASNGQWQGPLVMLQPVLTIALALWVNFIFGNMLTLFSASWHMNMWAPVVRMCAEKLKDCVFEGRWSASLHTHTWPKSLHLPSLCTGEQASATLPRCGVMSCSTYIFQCLHQSIANTVPFNLALLLLILTEKLNGVFVLCCQRWHICHHLSPTLEKVQRMKRDRTHTVA